MPYQLGTSRRDTYCISAAGRASLQRRLWKGAPSHETTGGISASDSEPCLHLNETMVTGRSRNDARRVNLGSPLTLCSGGRTRCWASQAQYGVSATTWNSSLYTIFPGLSEVTIRTEIPCSLRIA